MLHVARRGRLGWVWRARWGGPTTPQFFCFWGRDVREPRRAQRVARGANELVRSPRIRSTRFICSTSARNQHHIATYKVPPRTLPQTVSAIVQTFGSKQTVSHHSSQQRNLAFFPLLQVSLNAPAIGSIVFCYYTPTSGCWQGRGAANRPLI